jgi:hypothetical protein
LLALLFVIITPALFGQTKVANLKSSSGTIVYVEHWQNEIIVVADSRVIGSDHIPHDDRCKINVFKNDGIFAAAGFTLQHARFSDGKTHSWNSRKMDSTEGILQK